MGLDFHYLLAISSKNRTGCDTEAWQLARGGRIWRPGEKAFLGIGAEHVIGWTKLKTEPAVGDGWRFMFPDTKWTLLNDPGQERLDYLNAACGAFKQGQWYKIRGFYGFANL